MADHGLIIGRTYYGPHETRRTLLAIDGDTATFRHFLSMRIDTCSVAEMLAFAAGSKRRTYVLNSKGRSEVRTKLEETNSHVTFISPGKGKKTVTQAAWAKWRNRIKP